MKRVLILSDFSPQARNAIRYAAHQFAHSLESMIILNAIFSPSAIRNTLIHLDDILRDRSERGLNADLNFAREVLLRPDVNIKTIGLPIRFDDAIREVLRTETVDLILLAPLEPIANGLKIPLKDDEHQWAQSFKVPVLALPSSHS